MTEGEILVLIKELKNRSYVSKGFKYLDVNPVPTPLALTAFNECTAMVARCTIHEKTASTEEHLHKTQFF
jgi:hypothetical protein